MLYICAAVTEWSGGLYVSPTIAGSRPGSLIAGAWAAMVSLGQEGTELHLSLVKRHDIHIKFKSYKLELLGEAVV